MDPEEIARLVIDEKLIRAGWVIQDYKDFEPDAALGVAVRELRTNDNDRVDYALFIDEEPVGLIEAKETNEGVHLSTVASEQNQRYIKSGLKGNYDKTKLRFIYEATDIIINFTDLYDPKPRLRPIFSFPTPESLVYLMNDFTQNGNKTLRGRMQEFPELPIDNFRKCQINAITNLEKSFSQNKPRALIQMATGAGKTYAAITNAYRLLKHAKAKRILFLVDTRNLGEQAEREFKNYKPYDSTSILGELYNIQRIQTSNIPQDTNVCISTIQRLYSMLKGDIKDFVENSDEESGSGAIGSVREVVYNKEYPPEFFDVIIIDECHRSIYNVWKQVLDYFDAFLVGLTATPTNSTYGFFNQNVVSEYTHEQAVDDRVNVPAFGTYIIETVKNAEGGKVSRIEQKLEIRDKRTRKEKWEEADEDVEFQGKDLDHTIVNKSTIRLILETFKNNWKTWIYFQDRTELPKTLIFAKNDSHAADIVEIAREVFGEGNDFCKKITYTSEENEQSLLYDYRNAYYPRIAVTVSKIATGTDVKPIEILVFMRDIRNENYYEQMLGRARRTVDKEELKQASPSAKSDKLGYVIVDAIGVTKSKKISRGRGGSESKPTVSFNSLMDSIVNGDTSEDTFSSLGGRIRRLGNVLTDKEREQFKELSQGVDIQQLATDLMNAHNEDEIQADIEEEYPKFETLPEEKQQEVRKEIIKKRCKKAAKPLNKPKVRNFLLKVRNSDEQTIDPALDSLKTVGFDTDVKETNENICKMFKDFIDKYKDEIDALQIIYNQEFRNRHITEKMIDELYSQLSRYNASLNKDIIFSAYEEKTKNKSLLRELVDIIQIIRYEWEQIAELVPFAIEVNQRYKEWIFNKNKNKEGARGINTTPFTEEQLEWLKMIRDYIAKNASMNIAALKAGSFAQKGGTAKFYSLFGNQWESIINELNEALVA